MGSILRFSSLSFKIILVVTVVLIAAISLNAWLNIRLHEVQIKRLTLEKTRILSESIERNVIQAMQRGKHQEIDQILRNFASEDIWKINIFGLDGIIRASTNLAELNRDVGNVDVFLSNSYFLRGEKILDADGKMKRERIYYFSSPIMNQPQCHQCHDSSEKVIGILAIANSLKKMDREIFMAKVDSVIVAIIMIGSLSLLLSFLFLKFVNSPIAELTKVMKKVEQGDLSARVKLPEKDEMGRLGKDLNAMIDKLDQAKKEAEEYHRQLVQRADRMASIGELASGIAHEIRNPLAGIQGAIQILGEGFPKGDERRGITGEIQKQIYKLERLVKDLLNYAKPLPANYLPADVNELVDKVIGFFMIHQGRSDSLKIEKRFASTLPKVMIDSNSLEQAFLNIILNAQNAMPQGGDFTVSTRLQVSKEDGREVQIIFEDTGIGIPKKNLSKIFSPFFSTRTDGTGLGLSITKNIVEQHGGRIEVESQVNVGTKFTIVLPVIHQ
ncbi:MAG: ATP-binding protein [Thermodesulfobacteriota bacterium]